MFLHARPLHQFSGNCERAVKAVFATVWPLFEVILEMSVRWRAFGICQSKAQKAGLKIRE